jgi:hypothetical protein
MAAKREITSLDDYKRELLARSDLYRQTLTLQTQELRSSVAWVPRSLGMVRSIAPILAVAAPIAGFFFARKKITGNSTTARKGPETRAKKGFFATALMGFQLYNRVRPILSAFAQRPRQREPQHHR